MIGKFCVCRCTAAGVHAGYVQRIEGSTVELTQARRLWDWYVPPGAPEFLSGVALEGLDPVSSQIGEPIHVLLTEVCEVIECVDSARDSILAVPGVRRTR
jgi:hypothetical protein